MAQRVVLGEVSEIPEGKVKSYPVGEKRVAVFHREGEFLAIEDRCTHADVRLSDGFVDGTCVSCPWHGAQFDLRTGEALSLPAIEPVQVYAVFVEEGKIGVETAGGV